MKNQHRFNNARGKLTTQTNHHDQYASMQYPNFAPPANNDLRFVGKSGYVHPVNANPNHLPLSAGSRRHPFVRSNSALQMATTPSVSQHDKHKSQLNCFRCGRKGHKMAVCSAVMSVDGRPLSDAHPQKAQGSCHRCGRFGHYASECVATHDVQGAILSPVAKGKTAKNAKLKACHRCGKYGHLVTDCMSITHLDGHVIHDASPEQRQQNKARKQKALGVFRELATYYKLSHNGFAMNNMQNVLKLLKEKRWDGNEAEMLEVISNPLSALPLNRFFNTSCANYFKSRFSSMLCSYGMTCHHNRRRTVQVQDIINV